MEHYVLLLLLATLIAAAGINNCHGIINRTNPNLELDRVASLPGQNFDVNFAHYSGYIQIDEASGKNLFYWFFEAEENPDSMPLLLWLNGGPGCSAVAFGEAEEIGPFHINKDGKSVYLNPHSWNKEANVIFLDSPVGVGFSYSNTPSDNQNSGDKSAAKDNLAFLLKWLDRFPQYKDTDFYLVGESYAGHFIPQLAEAITKHNTKTKDKNVINLKGLLLGNPLIDDHYDQKGVFDYMWTVGMISDKARELLIKECANEPYLNSSKECNDAHSKASDEIGKIDYYSIFTPPCSASSSSAFNRFFARWQNGGMLRDKFDPCTEKHSIVYFNLLQVQKALHVHGAPKKWETCSNEVHYTWKDSVRSVLPTIKRLISTGTLKIWIYSGNTDAVIPVTSTRLSIRSLKLPTVGPWRPLTDAGQVSGWRQDYEGLTLVVIHAGGHEVPLHKPIQALSLFKSFLSSPAHNYYQPLLHDS